MRPTLCSGGRSASKPLFWRPVCVQNSVLAAALRPKLFPAADLRPKLRSGGRCASKPLFWRPPICVQHSVPAAVLGSNLCSGGRLASRAPFRRPFCVQTSPFLRFAGAPLINGPPVFCMWFGLRVPFGPTKAASAPTNQSPKKTDLPKRVWRNCRFRVCKGPCSLSLACWPPFGPFWRPLWVQTSVLAAALRPKYCSGGPFASNTNFLRPLCVQTSVLAADLRPNLCSGGRLASKTKFWRPLCVQN